MWNLIRDFLDHEKIMTILVMMIKSESRFSKHAAIKECFRDPLFEVHTIRADNVSVEANGWEQNSYREFKLVERALIRSNEINPNAYTIIVFDSYFPLCKRKTVREVVLESLKYDYDLFYLNKYFDMHQLHRVLNTDEFAIKNSVHLVESKSPLGVGAIMYSPRGKRIVCGNEKMKDGKYFRVKDSLSYQLNSDVYDGNLSAICTVPNIFHFDILNASQNTGDYMRLNECLPVEIIPPSPGAWYTSTWFFVVIFLLILILVVWAVVAYTRSSRNSNTNKMTSKDPCYIRIPIDDYSD